MTGFYRVTELYGLKPSRVLDHESKMIARKRVRPPSPPSVRLSLLCLSVDVDRGKEGLKKGLGREEGRKRKRKEGRGGEGEKRKAHFDDDHRNDTAVVVVVVEK